MGLVEVQRVQARLYVDAALRERFFADPQAVGCELGLAEDDIGQVMALSSQQVKLFANSLHNKRLGEVKDLLPFTARILGHQFSVLFRQYAGTHNPTGIKKHLDDAIHFADQVMQIVQERKLEPEWLVDIVRYEQARLLMFEVGRRFILCRFHCAMEPLLNELARGEMPQDVRRRTTWMVWWRLSPRGKWSMVVKR